jgi:hypothetical protein
VPVGVLAEARDKGARDRAARGRGARDTPAPGRGRAAVTPVRVRPQAAIRARARGRLAMRVLGRGRAAIRAALGRASSTRAGRLPGRASPIQGGPLDRTNLILAHPMGLLRRTRGLARPPKVMARQGGRKAPSSGRVLCKGKGLGKGLVP